MPRWNDARRSLSVPLLLGLLLSAAPLQADDGPIAFIGARIVTQTDQQTFVGNLVVQDGKVVALGTEAAIPDGARRIDAAGMVITPGWIDARSKLWLSPDARNASANNASLNVLDGVDPWSDEWQEVIRQGVTAVYVQPAAAGNLGGQGAVLRVAPVEGDPDALTIVAAAAAQASIGAMDAASSRDHHAQFERIKKALDDTKKYGEAWDKYRESTKGKTGDQDSKATDESEKPKEGDDKEGEKEVESGDQPQPDDKEDNKENETPSDAKTDESDDKAEVKKPELDPSKEFLLRVLRREIPLRVEVHRADDVRFAHELAEQFDLRLILDGVSKPGSRLETIRSSRVPLVLGPMLAIDPQPGYRQNRDTNWPQDLLADQARWALGTFAETGRGSGRLRLEAAAAVARGLDRQAVLAAVTSDAADLLGAGEQLGRIAEGRVADLAVFAGDPLNPATAVRMVFSQGQLAYENEAVVQAARVDAESVQADLPARLPDRYALRSENVLQADGTFAPATVLVEDGQIASVLAADEAPSDIPVFDLKQLYLTPGLVSAHGRFGHAAVSSEATDANASQLRIADVVDASQSELRKLSDQGVLLAVVAPGPQNVLSGTAAAIRPASTSPRWVEDVFGQIVLTARSRDRERYPASLAGQAMLVEDALSGRLEPTRYDLPDAVAQALLQGRQEQLQRLTRRELVTVFEVDTPASMTLALDLIERFKLRAAIAGADDLEGMYGRLKRLNVGLIVSPLSGQDYQRRFEQLVRADGEGIALAFAGDDGAQLRATAAAAVSAGLPEGRALQALTTGVHEMLGLPAATASITDGGVADLVIWNGSPVNLASRPLRVIVDGQVLESEGLTAK